jgi:hypothetical protein
MLSFLLLILSSVSFIYLFIYHAFFVFYFILFLFLNDQDNNETHYVSEWGDIELRQALSDDFPNFGLNYAVGKDKIWKKIKQNARNRK